MPSLGYDVDYDPMVDESGVPPTLSEAENGKLVTTGFKNQTYYEVRRLGGRYFAFIPGDDVATVMSDGKATQTEALETAKAICDLVSH